MSSMRCQPASLMRATCRSEPVLPSSDPSSGVRSTPAQFTSTSTTPCREVAASNIASIAALSETSHAHALAAPPMAPIESTVRVAAASSRSWHTTAAPSPANRVLIAAPRPPPAPVTTAILSSNLPVTTVLSSLPVPRSQHGPLEPSLQHLGVTLQPNAVIVDAPPTVEQQRERLGRGLDRDGVTAVGRVAI